MYHLSFFTFFFAPYWAESARQCLREKTEKGLIKCIELWVVYLSIKELNQVQTLFLMSTSFTNSPKTEETNLEEFVLPF